MPRPVQMLRRPDGSIVDWSIRTPAGRRVEIGWEDGPAVMVDVPEVEFAAWHATLTASPVAAAAWVEAEWDPAKHPRILHGLGGGEFTAVAHDIAAVVEELDRTNPRRRGPSTRDIRDGLASGIARAPHPLAGGAIAATTHVVTRDGTDLIHKSHGAKADAPKWLAQAQTEVAGHHAASEYLASLVGHAVGAPVPSVVRDGERDVYMGFVPGMESAGGHSLLERAQFARIDDGVLLGLLDHLIGNEDRNGGNWLISADGKRLAGIDHGNAWVHSNDVDPVMPQTLAKRTFMSQYVDSRGEWTSNDLSPADIAWIRPRLQALREAFAGEKASQYSSPVDWYEQMMLRFEEIARHAKGTRNRVAPANAH